MDASKEFFKRWPTASLYALILYFVAYSAYYAYETYRKNAYEAERPYIQNLFDQCLATSDLVARIASAVKYPESEIREFWATYYGKFVIIENDEVADAMKKFAAKLQYSNQGSFGELADQRELTKASLALAGACRDLIKSSWDLSMQPWKKLEAKHGAVCTNPKC